MERPFNIITFDCYGTLIDWESGIANAFLEEAQKDGIALRRDDVLRAYEHHEPIVEHERYRTLPRMSSPLTALRVARALGWRYGSRNIPRPNRSRAGRRSPTRIPPWSACAPPVTASASSPMSTTICSPRRASTSRSTSTCHHRAAGRAPTSRRPDTFSPRGNASAPHRWLHAAQSNFHDIVPVNAIGIPNGVDQSPRRHACPRRYPDLRGAGYGGARGPTDVDRGSRKDFATLRLPATGLHRLHDHRRRLAAADADRREAALHAALLQGVDAA